MTAFRYGLGLTGSYPEFRNANNASPVTPTSRRAWAVLEPSAVTVGSHDDANSEVLQRPSGIWCDASQSPQALGLRVSALDAGALSAWASSGAAATKTTARRRITSESDACR